MTDINHDEINQQQLFPDANEANTAEQDQASLYGPADGGVVEAEYTKTDSIPHSGNLGLEKPVKEFDTHLGVAHEKGLITPLKIEEDPRNPEDKKKMSLGKKIGAFTAAVVLAGGAAFVAKGLAGSGDNTPEAAPVPAENTTDEVVEDPSNPVEVDEPVAEENPEDSSEVEPRKGSYPFLNDSESLLLSELTNHGYSDTVSEGNYYFESSAPESLLTEVGEDILAALNLRDTDALARVMGGESSEDFDYEGAEERMRSLERFYATEDYVRVEECVDNGNTVSCTGYMGVFSFYSGDDINNADILSQAKDTTLGKPSNAGQAYLEFTRLILNKDSGSIQEMSWRIVSNEPSITN